MAALTPEEKRRFLQALREDLEFRRAVAAEVGLLEILEEIRALREDTRRLQEQATENVKAIRELQERIAEHSKAILALQEEIRKAWR